MNKLILLPFCFLLVSGQYARAPSYYGVQNGQNYYRGYGAYNTGYNSGYGYNTDPRMYYQQQYAQQQQQYNNYYYPYNYNNYYSNSYAQQPNWGGMHNDGNGNMRIGNDLAAFYITCNGRGCPVRG